ncbi:hypothetical protein ES703_37039 [subsurface metagenome]
MTGQNIAIRHTFSRFFLYCFLILGALFFLMPVYTITGQILVILQRFFTQQPCVIALE